MNIPREAILLRLFLNANDRMNGKAIYRRSRDCPCQPSGRGLGLPGGFQLWIAQANPRRQERLSLLDIPVVVEVIDSGENIGKLQAELDSMINEGLVVTRPVQVRHYAGQSIPGTSAKTTAHERAPSTTFASGSSSTMKIEGDAQRVTVYIGNSDTWRGRNLVTAIVQKCRGTGYRGGNGDRGRDGLRQDLPHPPGTLAGALGGSARAD